MQCRRWVVRHFAAVVVAGNNRVGATIVATTAVAGLIACGAPAAPSPVDAARLTSLRIATIGDERTLQPYSFETGYPGWNMLTLVYDTLFILDADNEPQPWVARSASVDASGLTHTITLRDDARWHDGRPLTSADVKFTFEYYRTHPYGRWTPPVRDIARIETPDPTTVVVRLSVPDPSFRRRLMADVPLLPKHVWESVTDPKTFAGRIGSGIYRLADYRPDQSYRFTANREHFSGTPVVDELVMPVIKDAATAFAALESGEIHATTQELPPELVARFQDRPGFATRRGPGYATTLLQFNAERPPWNQAAVRQAVARAIDTRPFIETLLLGLGTPGSPGWLHPDSALHDPAITPDYDVTAATRLLDQAGFADRDGDGVREANGAPLAPVLLVQANSPSRLRAAELIAAQLKTIGIAVQVRAQEATSLTALVWPDFDVTRGRNFDWTMFGWSPPILVDPLRIVSLVDGDVRYGTNNIGGYRSAEASALAARIRVTLDPGTQRSLVRQLEAVIARDRPFTVLWYPDLVYAYAPSAFDGWVFQKGQGLFHRLSFRARDGS